MGKPEMNHNLPRKLDLRPEPRPKPPVTWRFTDWAMI